VALFIAPLGALLLPQAALLCAPASRPARRWPLPAALITLGLCLLGVAALGSGFSPERPRPDKVAYVLDANAGSAQWVSADAHLDHWTAQFFPAGARPGPVPVSRFLAGGDTPAYAAPAPAVALPAPLITLLEEQTRDGVRTLRIRVNSPRGASQIFLAAQAPGPIVSATLDGRPLDLHEYEPAQRGTLDLAYAWDMGQGLDLTLAVRSAGEIAFMVVDMSDGLPELPGVAVPPRPADTMPSPGGMWDPTVIVRTYHF
jgi:hypothetical protein